MRAILNEPHRNLLREPQPNPVALIAILLSGISVLIYEILWMRFLTAFLGNTTLSAMFVLSVLMLGMGLGSWIYGRWAHALRYPIYAYAVLEVLICVFAGLTCLFFWMLNLHGIPFISLLPQDLAASVLPRYLIAFIAILPCSILIGGTWPAFCSAYCRSRSTLGHNTGVVYAVNILGGVLGAVLCGFWLIGSFGIAVTCLTAVCLNLFAALIAFGSASPEHAFGPVFADEGAVAVDTDGSLRFFAVALAFVTGFSAMGYELLWTRTLVFFLDNSTWAFSAVLITFLSGIAAGSLVATRFVDRLGNPLRMACHLQAGIAASSLLSIVLLWWVFPSERVLSVFRNYNIELSQRLAMVIGGSFLIVFLSACLFGSTFVVLHRLYSRPGIPRSGVFGSLYAANTFGSCLGPVVCALIFIPMVGLKNAVILLAILNLSASFIPSSAGAGYRAGTSAESRKRLLVSARIIPRAALIMLAVIIWQLHPAPYRADDEPSGARTLYYKEDTTGSVKVYENGGIVSMSVDAREIASSTPSLMQKQKLLAHLPLLLHADDLPKSVLCVGLGSGITAGAAALWDDVEAVHIAETAGPVFEASDFFKKHNHSILQNPKTRAVHQDGYNYLLMSSQKYDIISSDGKLNPSFVGNGLLYSRHYYALCKKNLSRDGLFIQWIPLYLPPDIYQIIVNTLASVFDDYMVFVLETGNTFYVAGNRPIRIDVERFMRRFNQSGVLEDLRGVKIHNAEILISSAVCDRVSLGFPKPFVELNTANYPCVEFMAPFEYMRTFTNQAKSDNLRFLAAHPLRQESRLINNHLPGLRLAEYSTAMRHILEGKAEEFRNYWPMFGREHYETAIRANPIDERAIKLLNKINSNHTMFKTKALNNPNDPEALYQYAKSLFFAKKDYHESIDFLKRARQLNPTDVRILNLLGNAYHQTGDNQSAKTALEQSLAISKNPRVRHNLSTVKRAKS